jgi:hypothetical protein
MTENNIVFVLLAIDTNPGPAAPNEIWAFPSQAEAENVLRDWSQDFLYSRDLPDAELVKAFRNAGARIHLYACSLDGDSEELVPFERESEAA